MTGKNIPITYQEACAYYYKRLGDAPIIQLAACTENKPTIRTVSGLVYDGHIWFKTDKNFPKTKQLMENPNVALCKYNINCTGTVKFMGAVYDEPGLTFEKKYKELQDGSYGAYSHKDTEVFFRVDVGKVEIWDTDENNYAFTVLIDFETETAQKLLYD